jgi:PPP family 3-phenylpropionic acid transporter
MRLRALYFVYYAAIGVLLGYFAPYLRGLGFDGKQIGAVVFAQQCAQIPAALFWGSIGDRIGPRALRFCTLGAAAALTLLPFARTPLQFSVVLALAASFSGGIVPLVDAATVRMHGPSYARARLWGSIGFVVTAQGMGLLLAERGERAGDLAMPLSYWGCFVLVAIAAFGVRGSVESKRPHWSEAFALLRDRRLLVVMIACALHWAANGPYHLFFGVLVRERGFSSRVTGTGLALGVASEVLAMLYFPALQQRFTLRSLFIATYLITAVRWVLVAQADSAISLSLLQLLHAASFGLWWGCSVEALRRIVPERLRATGQALFSAVVFGGGNLVGYALSGAGYDLFGGAPLLFLCAGVAQLLPAAISALPLAAEPARA